MAQTGYTPISIYYSSTASATPTAGNLVAGELAINTADGKLFYKDSSGVVQVIASKSTGTAGGSNTQVQYNSSGSLAGSSSFVFDGTSVGIGASSPLQKLHVASASSTYIQVQNTGNSVSAYYGVDAGGAWMGTSTNNYTAFYTNNAEKMRIAAGGFVGIANNNPTYPLDVSYSLNGTSITRMLNSSSGGSASAVFLADNGTNQAQYGVAGANYSGYGAVTAGNAWIYSANNITLMVDNGSGVIKFTTGGNAESMRLNATGNLILKGGTIGASGVGVTFPATQASSTDANCLDDYEEGTWSPSIGGTSTYTVQVGKYTKIGNVVTAYFYMILNSKGTGSSFGLTSLPFVGSSVGGQPQFGLMGNFNNVVQNVYWMYYYNDAGTTNLNIGGSTSLSTGAAVPIAQMQNGTAISGSITYFTT